MHSISEETTLLVIATIFSSLIVVGIFILVFVYQNKQKSLLAKHESERVAFNQTILQTQIEIQEQTLTNISKELHDNIGQTLSLAKLTLNTISKTDAQKANESIATSKELISQSLIDIRNLSRSMLGEKITEIGLQQAIKNELRIMEHTGKYSIRFEANEILETLSPQQELVAFRIVQEALHNIEKHAQASNIFVQINYQPSNVVISINDNGKGFFAEKIKNKNAGIGITNMQTRAKLIGASFTIESAINQGTTVILNISK